MWRGEELGVWGEELTLEVEGSGFKIEGLMFGVRCEYEMRSVQGPGCRV